MPALTPAVSGEAKGGLNSKLHAVCEGKGNRSNAALILRPFEPAVQDALLDRVTDTGAVVPGLWRLEVANAFQTAIRRQRIDAVYRDASLAELGLMPITVDADTNTYAWSATLRLSERFSLTVYDAAYLELAHDGACRWRRSTAICERQRQC